MVGCCCSAAATDALHPVHRRYAEGPRSQEYAGHNPSRCGYMVAAAVGAAFVGPGATCRGQPDVHRAASRVEIRIDKVAINEYAREVLPHSAALWAAGRSLEKYADDLREFASTGYGRRRFKLVGIRAGGEVVSSCKRYERELRCGDRMLRAIGIGAVFTREDCRGRGLATTLIAALLDAERDAGTDVVFLFSDIRPHFYEELGFVTLPSRTFTMRADSLPFERIR